MTPLRLTTYLLWIAQPILLLFLANVIRKLPTKPNLTFFYAYTVFRIFRFAILFLTYQLSVAPNFVVYFTLEWIANIVEICLSLAVIHELYQNMFEGYDGLRRAVDGIFRWAAAMLILVGAVTVAASAGPDPGGRFAVAYVSFARASAFLKAGLLLLLFISARRLALQWRHYVFGIAIGFALHASVELTAMAVRARVGLIAMPTYNFVNNLAYDCAILIWVSYLLKRERAARFVEYIPHHELEDWNTAIVELIER